ncbi:MAG: hypothetical protein C0511_14960 [Hyphomicrobium sp.]|nr:hypothetical protein [Hyphomicrobium sp.]PPC80266.1 MAG: hypothetical protein CTY40_09555 [Hyphomicrobium sp.]
MTSWPATTWTAAQATVISFLILGAGLQVSAELARAFAVGSGFGETGDLHRPTTTKTLSTLAALAGFQSTVVVLTLLVSCVSGSRPAAALMLRGPAGGARIVATALLGLAAFAVIYAAIALSIDRSAVVDDLAPARALIRSEHGLAALVVLGVGAPLAEELLFRGFLYPALSKSRLGLAGAAIVSTLGWTALHAGYSLLGLVEVFLIGLYFCWLLVRTGSLWVPMLCHGVYNTTLALGLKWLPISL